MFRKIRVRVLHKYLQLGLYALPLCAIAWMSALKLSRTSRRLGSSTVLSSYLVSFSLQTKRKQLHEFYLRTFKPARDDIVVLVLMWWCIYPICIRFESSSLSKSAFVIVAPIVRFSLVLDMPGLENLFVFAWLIFRCSSLLASSGCLRSWWDTR